MRTDLFDFELPQASIALRPASPRDSARMLVVQADGVLRDRVITDLPQWLEPGDQLVVNDTRVIPAQLSGRRIGRDTEPKIEATLIKRLDGSRWQALVKPAKKLTAGDRIRFSARVSAGTYLRSFAHDLGIALGTGAHLAALRRTRVAEELLWRDCALQYSTWWPACRAGTDCIRLGTAFVSLVCPLLRKSVPPFYPAGRHNTFSTDRRQALL